MSRCCSYRPGWVALATALVFVALAGNAPAQTGFVTFESGQVRPLAISPDGLTLFAVNTPDNRLELFDIELDGTLTHTGSVRVGMEPVAVAARTNTEVWVVNHLSDSVSIVDLSGAHPRVARTLLVGDEPRDIVFAGSGFDRAFISTAHRGQNSPFPLSQYDSEGVGRSDVWVFEAGSLGTSLEGDRLTLLTFFSERPRALAVNDDGSRVYVAAFRSGNQTTVVGEALVCDTITPGTVRGPCTINGASVPGGLPLPHRNQEDIPGPEVGLIVKFNRDGGVSDQWQDELGRNWNNAVNFDLPDRDVFEINADADPPVATGSFWTGVGTTLFNMVVNPANDKIYVSNTDSKNEVRFEGPGTIASGVKPGGEPATVRGDLARSRITVLDVGSVSPIHLNKHIDYSAVPTPFGVEDDSLATPTGMALVGTNLYVAALGSGKLGKFDTTELENDTFTPDVADHVQLTGEGPTGLVADGTRLYVMTRFNNGISVVDTTTDIEIQALTLFNPEPAAVVEGRPFLYDAILTGSNGEASCSACHIFGDMDDLAWDLGNPDDDQVDNDNPFNPVIPPIGDTLPHVFHPMKGPMTTQSLRGLVFMGPQHWRGDRQGDAEAGFNAFNVAFPGLVGRDEGEFPASEMQKFTDFALELTYPPNPVRLLDNSLRPLEDQGKTIYEGPITDTVANCNQCHLLEPENGFFGGDGQSTFEGETQHFKVAHLRNAYQKIGMFGMVDVGIFDPPFNHLGDQVRGVGFLHDGAIDTVFHFASSSAFSTSSAEQDQLEAFMMAFDTDLAPIVGQQVTIHPGNFTDLDTNNRIGLLVDRARIDFKSKLLGALATECDLVASVVEGGVEVGYQRLSGGLFLPDTGGPAIAEGTLRGKGNVLGREVTYTCVPFGSGERVAVDRDVDNLVNGVETNTGVFVSANDTGTDPTNSDSDGDGFEDGVEVAAGKDPNNPASRPSTNLPALSPLATGVLVALLGGSVPLLRRRRLLG